jgi:predicted nucleic acid-binding protein
VTPSVFLDSGIFVALLNRRDQWHAHAVSLFSGPLPKWTTSLLVVSETYSWFLHKYGEETARDFRRMLDSLQGLKVLCPGNSHHADCVRMLDRFRGSRLTYVDASSLVLIEQQSIRQIWSTDHHLALAGMEILPRT